MYQVRCDDYILYDPRDDELQLLEPKVNMEVNTVGEGSFSILPTHPFYGKLQKLKSVFSVVQDGQTIFRGRMTNDSRDFENVLVVDLEGVLAYTNDSLIPPFSFPDDFGIGTNDNVVEVLLRWFIQQHNNQVQDWQRLNVGTVTVSDPNNVIVRSSEKYLSTWDALKEKLFDSSLGGYLCVRYEADGNYIDYLADFPLTNPQRVTFGENILDVLRESDANETYTAMLPMGAETEADDGAKARLTLASLSDGDLGDGIVKSGNLIYSPAAVEKYGWICCSVDKSTWDNVADVQNLKRKAVEQLVSGVMMENTITIKAVDLGCTDEEIQSFRIGRNILVNSPAHGLVDASYQLTHLEVDILNPQNTTITIGDTRKGLTGINDQRHGDNVQRIESVAQIVKGTNGKVDAIQNQVLTLETSVVATAEKIIFSALEEYNENGDFGRFKNTVSAQLELLADQISMNFDTVTESVNNVNGDMLGRFENISKYIRFSQNGIEIGKDENILKLTLDNDLIRFTKNGITLGWWDGTDFHTGNIVVEVNERAQFGNFAFVPRTDGSLMLLKVGG